MTFQDRKRQPKTYEQQLIEEACLEDRFYAYNKLEPSAYFWKELTATQTQTPICLVPDTLILNEKQNELMWVYTDETGRVRRETNINWKDFVAKLTTYSSPNELVAILKRPIFHEKLTYSNDFKLLNSRFLLNSSQQQMGQKEQVVCVQRFIKSNGAKAFLCRTVYSQSSSQCYLVTNCRNFYDNEPENKKFVVKPGDRSTIVKSKQGKNLDETLKYLKQIVQYLTFFRGIDLSEIVGDFIKDELGNWWLVNVKGFKIIEKVRKGPRCKNIISPVSEELEKERYQKTKMCRYCERSYLESELTFKMTMRMIIEVDKYLLHLGKEYSWLKRSDISNMDSHILYQEHKVCTRCFRLYSEIQELLQVEKRVLAQQGCQVVAHPKELIFSQTNQEHLRLQAKNKEIHRLENGVPEMIQLGPNTNITISEGRPVKNDEIINKMIRFRLIVFLNEIDQVVGVTPGCNYYLEFTLFKKKSRFKLNMSTLNHKVIPLNKLKVFYFFAHSIEKLEQEYIVSNPSFKMQIVTEHKETLERRVVGQMELPFKELIIPVNRKKDFYKFFHIEKVAYGWGLEGSIGIIPSDGEVTTAKISFEKSEGQIYIPNENYYFCEPLTEEWMDLIKTKNQKTLNQRALTRTLRTHRHAHESSTVSEREPGLVTSAAGLKSTELSASGEGLEEINLNIVEAPPAQAGSNRQAEALKDLLEKEIDCYEKVGEPKPMKKKSSLKHRLFNLI